MLDREVKATDYSEGQKGAAHRVLIEIVNLLSGYEDDVRIIGGWVPDLLYPGSGHIGSIDVDVLLNHTKIVVDSYENIERTLKRVGYYPHPQKYFTFVKDVVINGITYSVDVDFLAGMYGGSGDKKRSQHIEGLKALKATGGNFAFDFPANEITLEAKRPDGALDIGHVKVVSIVPFFVMKAKALNRQKPKDAYDIYFCIENFEGGIKELAKQFVPYKDKKIIKEMTRQLAEKFASVNHSGPTDIVSFLGIEESMEQDRVRRDAFEKIQYLINSLI